ncbi:hypothetical protein BOTBODRAFT_492205 [Botryobasidium botryosum FD-172 SS1]|uniref:Uncharacterized protein n=1 Tax=Botryobasidium botryosum (strain FD-172 SS1) TaxID=930990 RepID=A0A067M4J5_BOTB1|nr:hypothetical protein BOTBODRAFT_492205 [Botryobasidium botryosum FD-172 SS1]
MSDLTNLADKFKSKLGLSNSRPPPASYYSPGPSQGGGSQYSYPYPVQPHYNSPPQGGHAQPQNYYGGYPAVPLSHHQPGFQGNYPNLPSSGGPSPTIYKSPSPSYEHQQRPQYLPPVQPPPIPAKPPGPPSVPPKPYARPPSPRPAPAFAADIDRTAPRATDLPPARSLNPFEVPIAGVIYPPGSYPTPELASYPLGKTLTLTTSQGRTSRVIQDALDTLGPCSTLYLPPRSTWVIENTLQLHPYQELATLEYPTREDEMAVLEAGQDCRPHVIWGFARSGIRIRNIIVEGNREKFGWDPQGGVMISLGQNASNQVVDHCIVRNPRHWSCIQAFEGAQNVRITMSTHKSLTDGDLHPELDRDSLLHPSQAHGWPKSTVSLRRKLI